MWIATGLGLLVVALVVPANMFSLTLVIVASMAFLVWTTMLNEPLEPPVLLVQVVIFNLPVWLWWLLLWLHPERAAWNLQASAVFAATYSFSYAAGPLWLWLEARSRTQRWMLIAATTALTLGSAAAFGRVIANGGEEGVIAASTLFTIAILFQRLIALRFGERLIHLRFLVLGIALVIGYFVFLLPWGMQSWQLLLWPLWLLGGSAFTIVMSIVREVSPPNARRTFD
jgi:hypothetical protein